MAIRASYKRSLMSRQLRNFSVATWLLAAIVTVIFALDAWRYTEYLIDDTFISLRYARNLVEGYGLVFDPGERIEGYTNFLFVVLAALFMRAGLDPVAATKGISLALALATLFIMARIERRGPHPGTRPALSATSVILLLPAQAFAYWSVASFEAMPFTFLLTVAVACLLRERRAGRGHASSVVFIALSLTRPEGAPLFVGCNLAFWLVDAVRQPTRAALRRHAVNGAIFGVGFGSYFAWRYLYYGRLLPNTFYAKVTGGWEQLANGLHHFSQWALEFPLPAATLLLPLCLITRCGRDAARHHPPIAAVYLITLSYTAYVVLVGGDFMPFYRFFLPIMPLCCLLIAWTLGALAFSSERGRRLARFALPMAVLVNLAASHAGEQPYRAFVAHRTAVVGERVGEWFGEQLEPDDLMAINTAGSLAYFSRLPTIDMLGLTDAQIAQRPIFIISPGWAGHRRGWGAYVLERQPRVILWYNSAGLREPFYLSDRELADNPFFRFFYQARAKRLPPPPSADPEGRLVGRFLGAPFARPVSGKVASPDLGLRIAVRQEPIEHTLLYEGPTVVNYFEFDARDATLWSLKGTGEVRVDDFVGAVAERWQNTRPDRQPDPMAEAQVEVLCERARRQVEQGDYARAKSILAEAARRNASVSNPVVYQYIANLAVMTGDLFAALAAQKEALRLAPGNRLYRRNLRNLLTQPYEQASKPRARDLRKRQ